MYFRGCTISAGHNLLTYYGSSVGAVERCNISIASRGLVLRSSPTMSDIELNNFASNQTLISVQDYNVTAYRVRAYNSTNAYVYNFSGVYIKLRNCNLGQFRKANLNANGRIYQEMSFDLNYRDANNAYIENVIITIKDRFGATFYSGPTDANGDLIQQWLLYDQFVGTSETRTYYFPYVITAEKAGYITDTFNHIPSSDGFVGNVFTRTLYAVGDQTDPTFDDTGLAAVQNDDAIDLTIPAGTSNSGPTGVMYAVYMKEDADPTPGTAGNLFSADFLQITNDLTLAITQKVGGDLLTDGEYRIAVLCVDYIGNVTGGVTVVTVNYVAPVPTLPPQVEDGSVDFETPPAVTGGSVTDPYPPAVAGAYIS